MNLTRIGLGLILISFLAVGWYYSISLLGVCNDDPIEYTRDYYKSRYDVKDVLVYVSLVTEEGYLLSLETPSTEEEPNTT